MAGKEEPVLSLRLLIAACTITDVGGCEALTAGFLDFTALAGFGVLDLSVVVDILM